MFKTHFLNNLYSVTLIPRYFMKNLLKNISDYNLYDIKNIIIDFYYVLI